MVKYHGTPCTGDRHDVAKFLLGRHALVPFFRPDDMQYVAEYCASFILDNSAYTIWTQGGTLDYDGYLAFVEDWYRHPGFDWAVIPDNISGTAADNDEWLARWPQHLKGVPVYHPHEPLTRLQRLAEQYDTVALGGSKEYSQLKTRKWWARINEMMAAVCDEQGRPRCKLHGLRMMDPAIFTRLPLASADSSNAARNASDRDWQKYRPISAGARAAVIADNVESYNSAPNYTPVPEQLPIAGLFS